MSESGRRSWDEAVEALRRAATEVRSAVGNSDTPGAEEDAAATRLKADVTRLEQSATELRTKLAGGLDQSREELESSFDRERAQQSADQIRVSLEELGALAGRLTSDIASVAGSSLKQAEPELKGAVRALEDVAGSAASWIRAVLDSPAGSDRKAPGNDRPPLDPM